MDAHRKRGRRRRTGWTGSSRGFVALAGQDFEHRGGRYGLADAKRLLTQVEEEINQDFEWMHLHDRDGVPRPLRDGAPTRGRRRGRTGSAVHVPLRGAGRSTRRWWAGRTTSRRRSAALQGARQVSQEQFQHARRGAPRVPQDACGAARRGGRAEGAGADEHDRGARARPVPVRPGGGGRPPGRRDESGRDSGSAS